MKNAFSWYNIVKESLNEIEDGEKQTLWPLNMWNGYVVLKHNSSAKIKNGVINKNNGKKNNYSNRTDFGNYFWGSSKIGKDNSNIHKNTYYCFVPPEEIYDMMSNEKHYSDIKEAAKHEKYVAANWSTPEGSVVVITLGSTPISYIDYYPMASFSDKEISGLYDPQWKLLRTYQLTTDMKKLKLILKKLKETKDIQIPEFLQHGYDYEYVLDYYNKNKKLYNFKYSW